MMVCSLEMSRCWPGESGMLGGDYWEPRSGFARLQEYLLALVLRLSRDFESSVS